MHCFISLASAIWSFVKGPQIHEGSSRPSSSLVNPNYIEDNRQFMAACTFLVYKKFSLKE